MRAVKEVPFSVIDIAAFLASRRVGADLRLGLPFHNLVVTSIKEAIGNCVAGFLIPDSPNLKLEGIKLPKRVARGRHCSFCPDQGLSKPQLLLTFLPAGSLRENLPH